MNTKNIGIFSLYFLAFVGVIAVKIWGEPLKPLVRQFFTSITGNDNDTFFLLVSSLITLMLFIALRGITQRKSHSFLHYTDLILMLMPALGFFILLFFIYREEIFVLVKEIWVYIELWLLGFSA